jgi:hypothetical protein
MQVEITGKIVNVLPTQSGQGSKGEWVKNAFVIEWQDNGYTQKLCLEVMGQDKWDKMKQNIAVGNDVLCKFSVSSREWNGKYFTTAQCFYCANVGGQQQATQAPQQYASEPQQDDAPIPF